MEFVKDGWLYLARKNFGMKETKRWLETRSVKRGKKKLFLYHFSARNKQFRFMVRRKEINEKEYLALKKEVSEWVKPIEATVKEEQLFEGIQVRWMRKIRSHCNYLPFSERESEEIEKSYLKWVNNRKERKRGQCILTDKLKNGKKTVVRKRKIDFFTMKEVQVDSATEKEKKDAKMDGLEVLRGTWFYIKVVNESETLTPFDSEKAEKLERLHSLRKEYLEKKEWFKLLDKNNVEREKITKEKAAQFERLVESQWSLDLRCEVAIKHQDFTRTEYISIERMVYVLKQDSELEMKVLRGFPEKEKKRKEAKEEKEEQI